MVKPRPPSCRCPAVQADALRTEKPNLLGKWGTYGGFVCVILLQIAFELVFQFLTRVLRIIHHFSVFSDGSELERSQTGGSASRKAGKASAAVSVLGCARPSCPAAGRPGRDGGRQHCCSQRSERALGAQAVQPGESPPPLAQQRQLVPPFLYPPVKLRPGLYSDVVVGGIENVQRGCNVLFFT